MTVSKKDIQVLIGFIGVAIAAIVYFFVFRPNMDQMEKLTAQNEELSSRVEQLKEYEANYSTYEDEIYTKSAEIDEMFAKFPADVKPEDAMLEAIYIQDDTGSLITDVTYNTAEELYSPSAASTYAIIEAADNKEREYYEEADMYNMSDDGNFFTMLFDRSNDIDWNAIADNAEAVAPEESEDPTEEEGESEDADVTEDGSDVVTYDEDGNPVGQGIYLMSQPVNYALSFDVPQMKRAVDYIVGNANRTVIDTIVLSFDSSTGLLAGQMDVKKYYVTGTGKTYEEPVFSGVSVGTDNLFSTRTIRD